ncbi:MAG: sodium:calcium antiporter [Syntrophothermus sp.]
MVIFLASIGLVLSLAVILSSCEVFTNGIEWAGKKLKLGEAVVGSLLAAVGTAMPETMIPIIAILFTGGQDASAIGIGAILGAPFMLSTLALLVTGTSVLAFAKVREKKREMALDTTNMTVDMTYFLIVYPIAILAAFINNQYAKWAIAIFLVILYGLYVRKTLENTTESEGEPVPLYMTQFLKLPTELPFIFAQVVLALAGIVIGAHFFVTNIEHLADALHVSPLLLSIIITPIATELPEKFNSIIWISRGKDTLAVGNITGAMVFQSSIPVAIGVAFTPWKLSGITLVSAIIALASILIQFTYLKRKNTLSPYMLLGIGGVLYVAFLTYAL